ncbi:hypothetical protein ATEIFO6365_0002099800 [Aspergillus terreus]|uniref:Uncharacterized protein n=1 Tax=Aspergillus terreus TaxID=33178 RepID=A0A5M3YVI6_ASPTE|nr:hypothetical protein ATETN484_0004081900 [Aspergillus terreus]GFF13887.1 hypothetical protein ATEIFO6365_0002099800 [Aspergillus terreus]
MVRASLLAWGVLLASPILAQEQGGSEHPELDKYCQEQYPGKHAWCKREYQGRCMKCGTCEGKGEKYYDPILQEEICCWNAGEKWHWNEEAKVGSCCASDAAFLVDPKAKKGDCCPPEGHKYFYDEKILLHRPESLMTLHRLAVEAEAEEEEEEVVVIVGEGEAAAAAAEEGVEEGEVEEEVTVEEVEAAEGVVKEVTVAMASTSVLPAVRHALAVVTATAEPVNTNCAERICPNVNGDTLGLEYGSCYRLKNPKGEALSRRHTGNDYVWGGYYGDLYQFRICKSTADCSKGGELGINDNFVINDQLGTTTDTSGKLFWMVSGALWHFAASDNAASAVRFSARPWCGDTCGICLRGDVKGLGPICPATNPGIGFKANPRYCQPLIVEKVPCINEDGTLERPSKGDNAKAPTDAGAKEAGHQEL